MKALLVLTLLLGGAQGAPPTVLVDFGRGQLDADDISQIVALSKTFDRGQAWLLTGTAVPGTAARRVWSSQAYLPPHFDRNGVRRGDAIGVVAWFPDDSSDRRVWDYSPYASSYFEYTQVAAPGRSPNDIHDTRDINRPFRVLDAFTDEELRSIVEFVRAEGTTRIGKSLPIATISRAHYPDRGFFVVRVGLTKSSTETAILDLRRGGDGWALVAHVDIQR